MQSSVLALRIRRSFCLIHNHRSDFMHFLPHSHIPLDNRTQTAFARRLHLRTWRPLLPHYRMKFSCQNFWELQKDHRSHFLFRLLRSHSGLRWTKQGSFFHQKGWLLVVPPKLSREKGKKWKNSTFPRAFSNQNTLNQSSDEEENFRKRPQAHYENGCFPTRIDPIPAKRRKLNWLSLRASPSSKSITGSVTPGEEFWESPRGLQDTVVAVAKAVAQKTNKAPQKSSNTSSFHHLRSYRLHPRCKSHQQSKAYRVRPSNLNNLQKKSCPFKTEIQEYQNHPPPKM